MIKIGIDFDNTIVNYEDVFYEVAIKKNFLPKSEKLNTKEEVKSYFISLDKENLWTEIQGLVYGKHISHAKKQPSLIEVLEYFKNDNYELFIVSHRTKYPYLGEKINLHIAAKDWIKNNLNKLIPEDNIFFEETIENKISRANEIGINYFIDDLEKVLLNKIFSKNIKKILYDPYKKNDSVNPDLYYAHSWLNVKDIIINDN